MEITEVRVKLVNVKNDKLRAFCSITVDNDFVIRDLKVIEGAKGAFVAMPSRKLTERCPRCGGKNHSRARYCNECGGRLSERGRSEQGNLKLHTDIAHPINSRCREVIQKRVLEVYQEEVQKSGQPGYKPMDFEVFDEDSLVEESAREIAGGPFAPSEHSQGPNLEKRAGDERVESGEIRESGSGDQHAAGENGGNGRPEQDYPDAEVGSMESPSPRSTFSRGAAGREGARASHDRPAPDGRERGRGRFRRGFRGPREDRNLGRGEPRRPDSSGRGQERRSGGRHEPPPEGDRSLRDRDRPPEKERDREVEGPAPGVPERDRETFLPPRTEAPAQSSPARERIREEPEAEPEDNFGAGLFS